MAKKKDLHNVVLPYREPQGHDAAVAAVRHAKTFTRMIRDEGPDALGAFLDRLDRAQLYALVTTLGAMVPVEEHPHDLLAWLDQPALPIAPRRTA